MVKASNNPAEAPEQRSPLVALLFWLCLFVSAGLYAVCALSPRIVQWATLHQRYLENQVELVSVQGHIKHLERVVDAMETDPDFAARLARSEFGAVVAGDDRIPLPTAINYDPRVHHEGTRPQIAALPWYVPILQRVSDDNSLRLKSLSVAAGVMLFAFLFFQERSLGLLRTPRRLLARAASRYVIDEQATPVVNHRGQRDR